MTRPLFALLLAQLAHAQSPDAGVSGVLTKAPLLLKQVEASFPQEALDAGVGGTVELEIDIGPEGKVLEARVNRGAGPLFDQAALEAARRLEFSPAEVDGRPAAVRIRYSYEFFYRPERLPPPPSEQAVNFSGVLLERGTRRPLAHATVVIGQGEQAREALSDEQGRFQLRAVPPGAHRVVVSSPEHARYEVSEEIHPGQRTEVSYFVRRRQYGALETVVRAPRERKEVTQVSLTQEEIRLIPGTQGDALRVVQNLPGVARAPFSIGLLIVRGGKPWDTRVYVDDALVPLLFHFGGLYATFNSNLVEEVSFQPGNFSAEYGRNIGGLVNAPSRSPARDGLHGYLDLNLIDSSALVEGPVGESWSLAASARRSYLEFTLPRAVRAFVPRANLLAFTVAPRYSDYQLKLERKMGPGERLWLMLFGSQDEMAFVFPNPAYDPEGRGEFATLMAYNRLALNYERALTEKLRLSSHNVAGYDRFDFAGGSDLYLRSTLMPLMGREVLRLRLPALELSLGADLLYFPSQYALQSPPRLKLNQIPDPFISRQLLREEAQLSSFEPGLFAEAVWRPLSGLKLVAGARADYDSLMGEGWLDPRAALFLEPFPSTTLKAAAGLFHQPPDYRQGQLSPKFGNPELSPEGAAHYSAGVEHRFTQAISLDLQLYYKRLFHQVRPTLALPPDSEASVDTVDLNFDNSGVGRSYGMELLLRHQLTRSFFGWLSYSLSRSERDYRGSTEAGLHPLDQPHNLIAVASYKLPYDFILGARVRYASGPLNTPPLGAIYDANGNYYYPLFRDYYSRRLPAFFQLDLRLDKRFVYERWMLSLYADVLNVTNRANVEGVVYNHDYSQQQYLYGLPIIPSLGIRGEL